MKKGDKKRRWWEVDEQPMETLTPEEEQFILALMGGCLFPIALFLLLIIVALFIGNA